MGYELYEIYYEVSDSSYVPEGSRFSEVVMGEDLRGLRGTFNYSFYRVSREEYVEEFLRILGERNWLRKGALDFVNVDFTDYGLRVWWYVKYEEDGDQYGDYWYVDRIEDCDEVESYDVSIFRVTSVDFKDMVRD